MSKIVSETVGSDGACYSNDGALGFPRLRDGMARVGGMTFMPITATCNVGGHLGGYRTADLVHDGGILPGGGGRTV